jgi:aspartate oxidase
LLEAQSGVARLAGVALVRILLPEREQRVALELLERAAEFLHLLFDAPENTIDRELQIGGAGHADEGGVVADVADQDGDRRHLADTVGVGGGLVGERQVGRFPVESDA